MTTISCPDFHHTVNGPLHELSRALKAASDAADRVGNPVLKVAMLYLRMTLYGPVERFFLDTYEPDVLVCERHPLVETFVYAPLYAQLSQGVRRDRSALTEMFALAEELEPGATVAVERWRHRHGRRVGTGSDVWTVIDEIVAALDRGPAAALDTFAAAYRTALPDQVLWLDTAPTVAAGRCAERGGLETHESEANLRKLRGLYSRVSTTLPGAFPDMSFERVAVGDDDTLEDVVGACIERVGLQEIGMR
ncbi:hypothetical protein [Rhodococcus sp. 27YEA15]|uniref:hypothetical protein n=1 Tax=Rhodococcus sp. 27YEA15 TaxID=3156259 RepID=UPI003C7E7626